MKILGIILALLMLASTAFVGLAAANKSHALAGQLAEVTKDLSADQLKAVSQSVDVPSGSRLEVGAVAGGIGGLAAIVLLLAAFAKRDWVKGLAIVTVGCTALSAAVYPHVQTSPLDGAAPRSLALVAIVLSIIGALGAAMATRPRA